MDLPPCRQKGSRFFYSIHRIHCETREKQKMTQESSDYFLLKKKKKKLLATATMTRKLPNPPVCSVAASKKKKRVNISFDFAPTAVFLPFSLVVIYVLIPLIPLNGRQADKRGKTPMVGRQTRSSWTKMATAIDWVEGFRRFGWNSKSFFFCRPKGTSSPNLAIGTDNERDSDRSAPPLVLRATFFLHRRNVEKEPQSKRVRIMS